MHIVIENFYPILRHLAWKRCLKHVLRFNILAGNCKHFQLWKLIFRNTGCKSVHSEAVDAQFFQLGHHRGLEVLQLKKYEFQIPKNLNLMTNWSKVN